MTVQYLDTIQLKVASNHLSVTDGTNTFTDHFGSGTPEGVVTANRGSLYVDYTNGIRYVKVTGTATNTGWFAQTTGGGTTNLAYTASATQGIVTSDTGTDATIPAADGTNAGVMIPAQFTKLGFITVTQAVDLDAMETDVADMTTLSGVASNATTLGTFTGTTIADSLTIKAALQALETALEATGTKRQSVVANIAARDALTGNQSGDIAYVVNATADVTVGSGAALYVYDGSAWQKISEFESLDLSANLSIANQTSTTLDILTSGGTDITVPQATTVLAGLLNAADKTKLNQTDTYSTTVGDGSATSIAVTHSLASSNVHVTLRNTSTGAMVQAGWTVSSTNIVTLTFGIAPTAGQYTVVISKVNA